MEKSGRRIRRKRTGRKYIITEPPPLALFPVIGFSMLTVIGTVGATTSSAPLVWAVPAGVCLLVVVYYVVKSFIPVKRYRQGPEPDEKVE